MSGTLHPTFYQWCSTAHLSKLSHISNFLPFQAPEISGDSTVVQIDNSSERLIEKRCNGSDGKATSFGSKSMDHSFESHVNLTRANDLSNIAWIIRFQEGDLDAFVGEVS